MSHQSIPSRIYLTGFMGCGKSTVGPVLARQLGYQFVDLDRWIEKSARKSVAEIFEEDGEAAFRALEAGALERTTSQRRVIVATGGGSILSQRALRLPGSAGMVIWLRLSADALAKRLLGETNRPLVRDSTGGMLSESALVERVEALLAEREHFYEHADFVLNVEGLEPKGVADLIVSTLIAPV